MMRMKTIVVAVFVAGFPVLVGAQEASDADAVRAVVASYGAALNAGNTDAIMSLMASDAVFMPADNPVQIGRQAIRDFFQNRTFRWSYDMTLTVAELVVVMDWAFARVDGSGMSAPRGGGASARLDIKYIMIMHKGSDSSWQIARLIFNRNSPLGGA